MVCNKLKIWDIEVKEMEKKNDYLEDLPSILDRIIVWTDNCDSKTSIILGGLGVIAGIFMASDYVTKIIEIVRFMTSHVNFWAVIYLIMFFGSIAVLLAGCFFLIRVLISVTDTKSYQERGVTEESLVFFSSIAKNKTLSAYKKKVQKTDNAQFEEDIISQIYICSIICDAKFRNYKTGLLLSLLGFGMFSVTAIVGINVT